MAGSILLTGAYGRHYAKKAEAGLAWEDGADFKIWGGPYTSIRDKAELLRDYGRIVIAYGNDNFLVITENGYA